MGNLKLPKIFQDGMVLQRRTPVCIWGTAPEGSLVTVHLAEQSAHAVAIDGAFRVYLPPMEAGSNLTLTVSAHGKTISIDDVAVGEVWLAGGQSNMEFLLRDDAEVQTQITGDHPEIRCFEVPKIAYPGQENDRDYSTVGLWRKARGVESKYFTAVGYYFAKKLHAELDVPVGIVNCSWGGTSASAYVTPDDLTGALKPYLNRAAEAQAKLDSATELERYRKLQYSMDHMPFDNSMSNLAPIKPDPEFMASMAEMGELFLSRYSPFRPCGLYETMLKPTAPYVISGVIWYQGESDAAYADTYELLMQQMIACWRNLWKAELPFLIVQLATFEEMMEPLDFVPIRAAQERLTKSCEKVWLACAMDAGMRYDIHPKHKRPIGERLALQALSKVYGKSILSDSPAPEGARREGDTIVLRFAHTGEGLTLRGETPETLELIIDGVERSAFSASVSGNELCITSPEIAGAKSVTVAFCQHPFCIDNVYNSAGLPMLPFIQTLEA
jgi:sialate O-acetylesterase